MHITKLIKANKKCLEQLVNKSMSANRVHVILAGLFFNEIFCSAFSARITTNKTISRLKKPTLDKTMLRLIWQLRFSQLHK